MMLRKLLVLVLLLGLPCHAESLLTKSQFMQAVQDAVKGGDAEAVFALYLTEGASPDFLTNLKEQLTKEMTTWQAAKSFRYKRPPESKPILAVAGVPVIGVIAIYMSANDRGTLLAYGQKDKKYCLLGVKGDINRRWCGTSAATRARTQNSSAKAEPNTATGLYFQVFPSQPNRRKLR